MSPEQKLFSEFAEAFGRADQAVIVIFYVKGRENPADFDVSSESRWKR
jgi:hypothetical protein